MTSATLRFPDDRLATFTSSFGAHPVSRYRVQGTEGDVVVDPAYGYATGLAYEVGTDGDRRRKEVGKRDQFAPELIHFSQCVLAGEEPEPDG
ncbi:MAG: gfo/Idh/MocA family oxidoreductase, partial [Gemmatimonadetes bacterium]|nr:gfo/Idh/MocA family oxidoreductase [Gemmatimonadota bacterium]